MIIFTALMLILLAVAAAYIGYSIGLDFGNEEGYRKAREAMQDERQPSLADLTREFLS